MDKIILVVILVLCFVGCDTKREDMEPITEEVEIVTVSPDQLINITGLPLHCADIEFSLNGKTVEFNYTEGKFDVVYDVNDLSGSAQVFFGAIEQYLNGFIVEKAKELNSLKGL